MAEYDVIGEIEISEDATISADYVGPCGRRHRLVRPTRVPAGKYVQRFELPIDRDVELLVEGKYLTFRGVPRLPLGAMVRDVSHRALLGRSSPIFKDSDCDNENSIGVKHWTESSEYCAAERDRAFSWKRFVGISGARVRMAR